MALASDAGDLEQWSVQWRERTQFLSTLKVDGGYEESAAQLRGLVRSGLLRHTDILVRPERFFEAHKILAEYTPYRGSGFWIRFTVQFNLFAGTIAARGGPEQVKLLDEMQAAGKLGCFGLTEKFAGVNSGLIVRTTATWDPVLHEFDLHTPDEGAHKNWISQGYVADLCVVVADLWVEGTSHGPHAFLMDFRRDGELVKGVTIGDMGEKVVANDLDNAWISFDHVRLPQSALLNRNTDIVDGKYTQKVPGVRNIDLIGQRLYTGRTVIAQAALVFARRLFGETQRYTDSKLCWSPKGKVPLSNIPQLKYLYGEANAELSRVESFVARCEVSLAKCLREDLMPDTALVEAIACAKVKSVETSIALCFKLKQEVGSFALMAGTGFEKMDYFQCMKFAEGDSRILMQKLARDRMSRFRKNPSAGHGEENALCRELAAALATGGADAWDEHWVLVYKIADAVIGNTIDAFVPKAKF